MYDLVALYCLVALLVRVLAITMFLAPKQCLLAFDIYRSGLRQCIVLHLGVVLNEFASEIAFCIVL